MLHQCHRRSPFSTASGHAPLAGAEATLTLQVAGFGDLVEGFGETAQ